jgi:hypothetical protein
MRWTKVGLASFSRISPGYLPGMTGNGLAEEDNPG